MLAFSGCYYGGGEKEKKELGAIRKRWKTLHVRHLPQKLTLLLRLHGHVRIYDLNIIQSRISCYYVMTSLGCKSRTYSNFFDSL
jgi:hypothetical protein